MTQSKAEEPGPGALAKLAIDLGPLIVFFAVGSIFLLRLDAARGIRDAGNRVPASLA